RMTDDFYRHEAAAKRGAHELLRALSERGISMSLATGGDSELSRAALERLGLMRYFKGLASCGEYGGKHSPAVYLAAARMAGGTTAETLVFEDSLHAAETAKNAGFMVAAVRDIGEPRQEELRAVADHYADDLTEYTEIIDTLIK
ncbi:MAG: HAD family hydrolase, partial [Oscillospiraceae bacterium]|nr:HAD family hydrolase [Oscillospiraceae bacterium]